MKVRISEISSGPDNGTNVLPGMERLQKSMTTYIKTLSKRNEGEDKEKMLPIAYLGSTLVSHGEDFENDSEFGQCLIGMPPIPHASVDSLLMRR